MENDKGIHSTPVDWNYWTPERLYEEVLDERRRFKKLSPELREMIKATPTDELREHGPEHLLTVFLAVKGDHVINDYATIESRREGAKTTKQLKDLSALVRRMLNQPEIVRALLKNTPSYVKNLSRAGEATPAEVIVCVLIAKAMEGDVRAVDQLRKMGYGDKVTVEAGDSFFNKEQLRLEVVDPKQIDTPKPNVVEAEVVEQPKYVITKDKNGNNQK